MLNRTTPKGGHLGLTLRRGLVRNVDTNNN